MIERMKSKKRFDFLVPLFKEEIEVFRDGLLNFQNAAEQYCKSGIKAKFDEHVEKFKNSSPQEKIG